MKDLKQKKINSKFIKEGMEASDKAHAKINKHTRKLQNQCTHMNGHEPTLSRSKDGNSWLCTVCGDSFPLKTHTVAEVENAAKVIRDTLNIAKLTSVSGSKSMADLAVMMSFTDTVPELAKILVNKSANNGNNNRNNGGNKRAYVQFS